MHVDHANVFSILISSSCSHVLQYCAVVLSRPPAEDSEPAARLYSVQLPPKGQPFSLTVSQRAAMDPLTDTPARAIFATAGTK